MVVLYLPLKRIRVRQISRTAIFIPVCNRTSLITAANLTKLRNINKPNSVKVYRIWLFRKFINCKDMKETMLERFKTVIAAKSKSPTEFCKLIGVAQTTLSNQLQSTRGVSVEVILLTLSAFPEVSAEWLLRGKGEMLLTDTLPSFHGSETDTELDVHAELARRSAELEECKLRIMRLEAQKDYLQERNDDLVVSARMLQDELNRYQQPTTTKKKDII